LGNLVLGYPDYLYPDASITTVALSGGSWSGALPLSNLLKRDFASVARSADTLAASTKFWADLGLTRGVRLVAMPRSNASRTAKIRVRGCSNTGATDISPSYALDLATATSFGPEVFGYVDPVIGYETANAYPVSGVRVTPPPGSDTSSFTWIMEWTGSANAGTCGGFATAAGFSECCYISTAAGTTYFTSTSPNFNVYMAPVVVGRNRAAVRFSPGGISVYCNGTHCGTTTTAGSFPAYTSLSIGGSPWWIYTGHQAGPAMGPGAPLYSAVYDGELSAAELQRLSLIGADPVAINPDNPAVVDTGWRDLYSVLFGAGTLPWGDPSLWDGRMDPETALIYPMPWLTVFPTAQNARYWLVEISDVGNPDGYFELPRFVFAAGWQPTRNFVYGANWSNNDSTVVQTTAGGADFFDQRARRRVARFSINHLPKAEAMTWANDMQYLLGVSGQVYFVWNPDDPANFPRQCFLSRLSTLSALVAATHGLIDTTFELTEIIA
jgi:hypothetical protein